MPTSISPAGRALPSEAAVEPESRWSRSQGLCPIEIGNQWIYETKSSETVAPLHGDSVSKHDSAVLEIRITGFESKSGTTYARMRMTVREPSRTYTGVSWERQDRTGLYEPRTDLPGRGSGIYEIRRLAYPLHVGDRWTIDEQSHITGEVINRELVNLPAGRVPAWKIRIRRADHQPDEEEFAWYGDLGFLGSTIHSEEVKPGVNPITITEDRSQWLRSADLVGPGRPLQ